MKTFRNTSKFRKNTINSRRRGLRLDCLEDRLLMAGIAAPADLVSWWSADNTTADHVGGNHGTAWLGATYGEGQVGQAFKFDGVDDRISVPDADNLKLTGSLTIEAWVRVDSFPTNPTRGEIFFRGDDRAGKDPYQLAVTSTGMLAFTIDTVDSRTNLEAALVPGAFTHVAASLDDATGAMRLYLNGVLAAEQLTTARPFRDLDPTQNPGGGIGNHGGHPNASPNFPFHGLIDELSIYSRALEPAEIQGIHHDGLDGHGKVAISIHDATAIEGSTQLQFLDEFVHSGSGGLDQARGITLQADSTGHLYLYAASTSTHEILRFDGVTRSFDRVFVSARSGGLGQPQNITFGPDGNAYVTSYGTNQVMRYDPDGNPLPAPGKTGAVLVDADAGLVQPIDIVFSGGTFLVTGENTHNVLRFGTDGTWLPGPLGAAGTAEFIPAELGGLRTPKGLTFGPDGHLYVTARELNSVMRFDGITGSPLPGPSAAPGTAEFVARATSGINVAQDIEFAADGTLYVSSTFTEEIRRYQGPTGANPGAFINAPVTAGMGGILKPIGLEFDNDGSLLVSSRDNDNVVRYGLTSQAVFTITLSAPASEPVVVSYTTAHGTAGGSDYASASGFITFAPGERVRAIRIDIVDDTVYEENEMFTINLTDAIGGAIVDHQGIGTIIDNDPQPTKFYVVNDATTNVTYEYGDDGAAIENYSLNSGNSAPRGAASTAAGDKVWVVDANRNVYVYSADGTPLGSWAAGSLANNASVQGIATDGTDIWIVDAKSDKVFRYAGAAARLSGSQNAASSFSLNSGNKDASDLVVRGSEMWVVNDSSTDKVFKYTTSGSLQGSWTITGGGGSPTGITVDPAGGADISGSSIWIVDSNTDRVYQFNGATARISGSDAPEASFALAAGNTNPQGIADPPAAGTAMIDATSEAGVPLGSALIDRVLSGDDAAMDLAESSLPLALAARRRLPEASQYETDEVDRWYANFETGDDREPSRRIVELEGDFNARLDAALAVH